MDIGNNLKIVVEKITSNFTIERIILFGSYAYGHPTTDSDIDLMVVMETVALRDIVINQIESKMNAYDRIIKTYQKKYGKNFDTFSKDLKNRVTPESEDVWMEWNGAIEMKNAWNEALKEAIDSESNV